MSATSWICSWKTRLTHLGTRPPVRRQLAGLQSRLEVLEDRSVPAAFGSALGIGNDSGPSTARGVAIDAAGNTYLTGYFYGSTDFDPARAHPGDADLLASRGGGDAFVAKYAPDNALVWARRMGGTYANPDGGDIDTGLEITLDGNGNVYIAGSFQGTADFGSVSLTSAGGGDAFVVKLNANGAVVWANRWGTNGGDTGTGVGVDGAGNVYAAVVRANAGHTVLQYSPTGATSWVKSIETRPFGGPPAGFVTDAAGNVFVCGSFRGTVDFDPGPKKKWVSSGAGAFDSAFVLKLTTAGAFSWVSPFVAQSGGASAQSLALDGGGNVIVGGFYNGSVDFNPGSGTTLLPTGGRAFIVKLTGGGGLAWAKAIEGTDFVYVLGLATDAAGNVYATGSFRGSADFDPGPGTAIRSNSGVYVLKLDAAGNFALAETFGGNAGGGTGYAVAVDSAGTLYLAGGYQGTVDFDPDPFATYDLTNPGPYSNLFLVKLTQP
jgi:hypothetical protein